MKIGYNIIRNRLKEMTKRNGRWDYKYIQSSDEYFGIIVIYDSNNKSFSVGTCSYFDDCGWYMNVDHVRCFGQKNINEVTQCLLSLFITYSRTDFVIDEFNTKTQRKIINAPNNVILLCFLNEGLEVEIEDMDEL